ncbi:hypothetical protein EJB06_30560 [Massilia atriviolacea]|uniref:Type VI secretion system tip protein VgrG n=1 Tax=Massilia atriviolacea TaxID=2495579 RepID=A0A430HCE2_9BURK|nr:contractile injection system protein, VgrG/Pvc8 family [Massilia atriviolacea]RSZ55206.1 hypothetical protein EJB06_30560 [Massilia atriviolacea]
MSEASSGLQALIDGRQNKRLLRLSFPDNDGPAAELLVNRLDAVESLSRPFEFTVELLSNDPHVPLKDLQGKMMCVQLVRGNGSMRYFTGRVFSFRLKTVDGGVSYYEARLGPWYQYLSLRKDNYLFHYTTMYDQTASIFGDYGSLADWDWRVQGATDTFTDTCQFDETDRNFLERRWVAAGIVYWFEHSERGHKLILSDDTTAAEPIDGTTSARTSSPSPGRTGCGSTPATTPTAIRASGATRWGAPPSSASTNAATWPRWLTPPVRAPSSPTTRWT